MEAIKKKENLNDYGPEQLQELKKFLKDRRSCLDFLRLFYDYGFFPERYFDSSNNFNNEKNFNIFLDAIQDLNNPVILEIVNQAAFDLDKNLSAKIFADILDKRNLLDKDLCFINAVENKNYYIIKNLHNKNYKTTLSHDLVMEVASRSSTENLVMLDLLFEYGYINKNYDFISDIRRVKYLWNRDIEKVFLKNQDVKVFDNGREIDTTLPPALVMYKNKRMDVPRVALLLNEFNYDEIYKIDSEFCYVEDGEKKSWIERRIGKRPLSSEYYNFYFQTQQYYGRSYINTRDPRTIHELGGSGDIKLFLYNYGYNWLFTTPDDLLKELNRFDAKKVLFIATDYKKFETLSRDDVAMFLSKYSKEPTISLTTLVNNPDKNLLENKTFTFKYRDAKNFLQDFIGSTTERKVQIDDNDFPDVSMAIKWLDENMNPKKKEAEFLGVIEIMKKSMTFALLLDMFDEERHFDLANTHLSQIIEKTSLTREQVFDLILDNSIEMITESNFEKVLNTFHEYDFENFDSIIYSLNLQRNKSYPKIKKNKELKRIVDDSCICNKPGEKCVYSQKNRRDILERGHTKCIQYFIDVFGIKENFFDDFREKYNYSVKGIKYLLDNNIIKIKKERYENIGYYIAFFENLNQELFDLLLEYKYIIMDKNTANDSLIEFYLNHERNNNYSSHYYMKSYEYLNNKTVDEILLFWIDYFYKKGVLDSKKIFQFFLDKEEITIVKAMHEKKIAEGIKLDIIPSYLFFNIPLLTLMLDNDYFTPESIGKSKDYDTLAIEDKIKIMKILPARYLDGGRFVDITLPPVILASLDTKYNITFYETLEEFKKKTGQTMIINKTLIPRTKLPKSFVDNLIDKKVGNRPIGSQIYNFFYKTPILSNAELVAYKNYVTSTITKKFLSINPSREFYIKNNNGQWNPIKENELASMKNLQKQTISVFYKKKIYALKTDEIESFFSSIKPTKYIPTFGIPGEKSINLATPNDAFDYFSTSRKGPFVFGKGDQEITFETNLDVLNWLCDNYLG